MHAPNSLQHREALAKESGNWEAEQKSEVSGSSNPSSLHGRADLPRPEDHLTLVEGRLLHSHVLGTGGTTTVQVSFSP